MYLQAVGEDDVRVHRPNVQMVNERTFDSVGNLLQRSQLGFDVFANLSKHLSVGNGGREGTLSRKPTNLVKVGDLVQGDFLLFFNGVSHRFLNPLQEEVESSWVLSTHRSQRSNSHHASGFGLS